MIDDLIRSVHLTAMVVWLAGMITTPLALSASAREPKAAERAAALQQRERLLFTPAMLLTWALGMTLALRAGWFAMGWIWAKVVLVLVISALHGIVMGQLSRLARDPAHVVPNWIRSVSSITIGCLLVIAVLATAKPF